MTRDPCLKRPDRVKPAGAVGQLSPSEREEIARAPLNEHALACYGVPVQLRLDPSIPPERLIEVLPPVATPVPWNSQQPSYALRRLASGDYDITVGRVRLAADLTLDEGLDVLDAQLRMALALEAKEHVFAHAGAVAVNGRGLILPGRTFTGKSTLTRALVEHGASYYSDEFAVLDAQGFLHPYPRPLSIRHAQHASGAAAIDPARLTATIGGEPVPVSVIAALEYHADTAGLECELVPATAGLTAILENCAAARSATERVLAAARQAASGATTVRGLRGEADAAARALLELVRKAG